MSARLAFVLTSALEPPAVVEQLIDLLDPFPVVVQHDFGAQPLFTLRPRPGRLFWVPREHSPAWGTWAGVMALCDAVRHALRETEADYVQLLSGSCLPLRPVQAFARHVADQEVDANAAWFDAFESDDTLMAYAWRLVGKGDRVLGRRVLRRLGADWFRGPLTMVPRAGLQILQRPAPTSAIARARALGAVTLTRAALQQRMDQIPDEAGLPPVFGSGWIGARRRAWEFMLDRLQDPAVRCWLEHVHFPDEHAWVSLLAGSNLRVGPLNHLVGRFAPSGKGIPFATPDLARIDATSAFFGRKFSLAADDPVRFAVVSRLQTGDYRPSMRLRVVSR